ncbi:lasso peptide biosynthesis B2 protein [Paenibacillus provencensis]|uniref:Lasso peptide biosynthesis B2 protein n=1 Tax=Paenibacillus provencensis TaxID=441151 RepID=A0ABW3PPG1_9BACL|nr:lasso peptide biosynthesis B2 protein [Paenibacillus sp. MER 78]MCM3127342.1 lasso peptide biosynthesis B2 protein [Paenibacillus sp. MER 78]
MMRSKTLLLRSFTKQKPAMRKLIIEAFFYLAYARVINLRPFSKVAQMLGCENEETSYDQSSVLDPVRLRVAKAIDMTAKHTPWRSECLVTSIAGMRMLNRRNIESTLYLGVARNESGGMNAHAWLRSGPMYVAGADGIEKYTVVGMFSNKKLNESEVRG